LIYRKFRIVGNQGCGFQYLILPPQSEPELHVANDFMNTFYESNPSIEPYYRYSIDATYGVRRLVCRILNVLGICCGLLSVGILVHVISPVVSANDMPTLMAGVLAVGIVPGLVWRLVTRPNNGLRIETSDGFLTNRNRLDVLRWSSYRKARRSISRFRRIDLDAQKVMGSSYMMHVPSSMTKAGIPYASHEAKKLFPYLEHMTEKTVYLTEQVKFDGLMMWESTPLRTYGSDTAGSDSIGQRDLDAAALDDLRTSVHDKAVRLLPKDSELLSTVETMCASDADRGLLARLDAALDGLPSYDGDSARMVSEQLKSWPLENGS
jgi:hypothetical protein